MPFSRTLRFDEAFDGASWPDPLTSAGTTAVFGRAHLGPKRLLALLELQLGLGGPQPSNVERVAALVPLLARRLATSGADEAPFYAESFQVDALGTAERLLLQRDRLALAGFDGSSQQSVSPRLRALAEATAERLPGIAERLRAVTKALGRQHVDIGSIELCEAPSALPLLWRQLLDRLAARGVAVETLPPVHALGGGGDLAFARAALGYGAEAEASTETLVASGDGSLQLLRPSGPLAAARAVAAMLACRPTLEGVVIVGADSVLDDALAAQGLPRLGVSRSNVLRSVLPTAIELGWQPPSPELAQTLLLVPDGPVPPRVAGRLLAALSRVPAVDSDAWREARERALQALVEGSDTTRRDEIAARLDALFSATVTRQGPVARCYPRESLERRLTCIETWARGRAYRDEHAPEAPAVFAVLEQCRLYRRALELLSQSHFSAPELRRLQGLVDEASPAELAGEAQAGLQAVRRPDAIVGAARCVIWWNFTRKTAPGAPRAAVGLTERKALAARGVELPEVGDEAARLARRWARPLAAADEQLVLVCPRRGDDGEEESPHPLWDELEARSDASGLRALIVSAPKPVGASSVAPRVAVSLALPPAPRRHFEVALPTPLKLRDAESPSSLERLGGCPLSWVLSYHAELAHGLGAPLGGFSATARGTLAHALLSRLFTDGVEPSAVAGAEPPAVDEAVTRLAELFDQEGPRLAAALFLPGYEAERADMRQRLLAAARVLLEHLHQHAARLRSSELAYERPGLGTILRGRPDLVLAEPAAVLDFKWGSRSRHEESLKSGTALQLALYAWLVGGTEAPLPRLAYFILRSQDLLVDGADTLLGVQGIGGPSGGAVAALPALFARLEARRAELAAGTIEAAGVPDAASAPVADEHRLTEDGLTLAAPCHFCSFDLLCARGLQRGAIAADDATGATNTGGPSDA